MRIIARFGLLTLLAIAPATARADLFEGFNDITTLAGSGWSLQNNSSPLGSGTWFQGSTGVFNAQAGAPNSYLGANFNFTTGENTINAWAMSPTQTFNNGDVIKFWTRTVIESFFADQLRLKLSLAGASTSASDFTTTLLTVNNSFPDPLGYPFAWTEFTATLSGLGGPTSGRFAFHYDVPSGGPAGANSNYIGIDTVSYTAVPEPTSALVLAGLSLGACFFRRRSA
jgi:hypothetical protein